MNKSSSLLPELAQSLASLVTDAVDQAREPIMIVDRSGTIVYGNHSVERVTGHRREEYLGQNCRLFSSGRHDKAFYRNLWEALLSGEAFNACFVNRHRDGTHYYESKSITPLKNSLGECAHFVSISREVMPVREEFTPHENLILQDQMTKLPNRLHFLQALANGIERASRRGTGLAVMYIDLDHFKRINDILGHQVGDEVLKVTARRLREELRLNDLCARLGGDEFSVMIEDLHDGASVGEIAHKLVRKISQSIPVNNNRLQVSCSVGISIYPKDGTTGELLMRHADRAMYRAKGSLKSRFAFYHEENRKQESRLCRLEEDVQQALDKRQFKLYYQPQVDLKTDSYVGVEALLRWEHPELGLIAPEEFFPILENAGQVRQVGEWAIQVALEQLKDWEEHQGLVLDVSINLSSHQLIQRDFVDRLQGLSDSSFRQCRRRLNIEITESMLMGDMKHSMEKLDAIDRLGIQVSLDDFGSGHSSLVQLNQGFVNMLKIDRKFIQRIPGDAEAESLVNSIIAIAHSLSMRVAAVGVETREQLQYLRLHGCDWVQGFMFSGAVQAECIAPLMQRPLQIELP